MNRHKSTTLNWEAPITAANTAELRKQEDELAEEMDRNPTNDVRQ